MCSFCFAALALVVAVRVSSSGLAAFAVKVSGKKNRAAETIPDAKGGGLFKVVTTGTARKAYAVARRRS
jgi:hypothetical protein